MSIAKDLNEFMKSHFGDISPIFVARELKSLHFQSVNDLNDDQKMLLIERLMNNCFLPAYSEQKCIMIRSTLVSIFKLSKLAKKNIERIAEIKYIPTKQI